MNQSQVREIALELPEATEEPHHQRTSFRVRGKIFATAMPDDPFLNIMLSERTREAALDIYSDCTEKLFWGKKVFGLTVDLRKATPAIVAELLEKAWSEKAPSHE